MKYTLEIEINKPVNQVVQLFDNPENMKKWMKGLEHFEHLSGTPGRPGAKSRLTLNFNGRKMEMIETVITRNLPDEFTGSYETKGGLNIVKNRFVAVGDKTRYVSDNDFQLRGFMKIIGWLMPGAFKKQTLLHLEAFQKFAEAN